MSNSLTPQQQKIIDFARSRGFEGFYSWEITGQLYILGYTERITELRQKGYNIVNVRKNFYVLNEGLSKASVTKKEVEDQLKKLREDWVQARSEKRLSDMQVIELKAKVLKLASVKPEPKKFIETESQLFKQAQEVLL